MGPEGTAWLARLEAEWARLRWLVGKDAPAADELVALWERTVAAFDYGNAVEGTRARIRLAGVFRAVGRTAEAAETAALARAAASAMRAGPLLRDLDELGLAASVETTAQRPDALTAREREVLQLVAAGRTNRQIGQQLYISDKTVSVHVSNVMAKLGARSRTEAAAIAQRDGLLPARS
jgi:DNA-binding NarL/FixJ family response regulator